MKRNLFSWFRVFWVSFACLLTLPAVAQVSSDGTLSTTVTENGNNYTIDNGDRAGNNLFHSFSQFSVPKNGAAIFNNAFDIENIFSRVTGGSISNIDGLIQTNGTANLFLLNPAGILFGPNASLNIGGSFIGTTANSIKFASGSEFSAVSPFTTPLLSISTPIGLQFGPNPAPITVEDTGHNLTAFNTSTFIGTGTDLKSRTDLSGLGVSPGNTLALVGGSLTLNGGIIKSNGPIELGANAVGNQVGLIQSGNNWTFDYGNSQMGDVTLKQRSIVDASGIESGSIHIQGRQILLQDASFLAIENLGSQASGNIQIQASELIQLAGVPNINLVNGIISQANGTGSGSAIAIDTPRLLMQDGGGVIGARTYTSASSGDIVINAPDIQLLGSNPFFASYIATLTTKTGRGGNVTLNTQRLTMTNLGVIGSANKGSNTGGSVTINASEFIEMTAPEPANLANGLGFPVSAVSPNGSSGNVTINTGRLVLADGGLISSSTYGQGNGGTISINATESVDIRGSLFAILGGSTPQINPSTVRAAAIVLSPSARQLFGLPDRPTGNSGTVIINTPRLNITDGAEVSVRNDGLGNAGNLDIDANSILLDREGKITANTFSGEGGNINLQVRDALILRHDSFTSTTAGNAGNGGNITINANTLAQLENSDITANAFQGKGGNIQIATQGIFRSLDSDITASSQLGVSGVVNISIFNFNSQNVVFVPNHNFVAEAPVIASSCLTRRNTQQGRFVVTGNGGFPETPYNAPTLYEVAQVRNVGQLQGRRNQTHQTTNSSPPNYSIQEATELAFTPDGKLALVANKTQPTSVDNLTCSI